MSKKIVICGGGVIGCSVAYHLSQLGVGNDVTVVEPVGIASAASGKAGGFLASSWLDEEAAGELARKSFALHSELATSLGEDYGYRRVDTLSVNVACEEGVERPTDRSICPAWVDGNVLGSSVLCRTDSSAQVHPGLFSQALMRHAQSAGVQMVKDRVTGLQTITGSNGKEISAVQLRSGKELEASVAVIAMGPWSHQAQNWLPDVPSVGAFKAHSITMRPTETITAHAVFVECAMNNQEEQFPEIYPRPDGEVYACGMADMRASLPDDAARVTPTDGSCEKLKAIVGQVSSALAASAIDRAQACFLPTSPDGVPIIGAVPGVQGAFMASGHGCWGILNSPATGKGLAELIVHGRSSSVDLSAFDPKRFSKRSRHLR